MEWNMTTKIKTDDTKTAIQNVVKSRKERGASTENLKTYLLLLQTDTWRNNNDVKQFIDLLLAELTYPWVTEGLEKYGEETTLQLIRSQKEHEKEQENNDCECCGKGNKGAIVDWGDKRPFICHFGIWEDGYCSTCGKHMDA